MLRVAGLLRLLFCIYGLLLNYFTLLYFLRSDCNILCILSSRLRGREKLPSWGPYLFLSVSLSSLRSLFFLGYLLGMLSHIWPSPTLSFSRQGSLGWEPRSLLELSWVFSPPRVEKLCSGANLGSPLHLAQSGILGLSCGSFVDSWYLADFLSGEKCFFFSEYLWVVSSYPFNVYLLPTSH